MRNLKVWLGVAVLGAALMGIWGLTTAMPSANASLVEEPKGDYWRNHDGHWSYWNAEDKRWYYTDGTHWFWHDGKAWVLYKFDKKFGHEAFVHSEYKVPKEEARVVHPVHEIFHH